MAAKRFLDDQSGSDDPDQSRMRSRPSFASVIGEAVMVNSLKNFCFALKPMLGKVVDEEVEKSLNPCSMSLTRSSSMRIKARPSTSSLQLVFSKKLSLPIYTGSKIVATDTAPLQIVLVETTSGQMVPTSLRKPIKLEIVVLDGSFPSDDRNDWTSDEFDNNIVKERTGKRPLLAGDCLTVTLRDGVVQLGEIEFTDNSSWIRSGKLRLGARVAPGSYQGVGIREAMTEAFIVKDHRGELYKKHHPPMLHDEVWRLEKIAKDGAFHKKLAAAKINSVQDFLKLSTVDPQRLRRILGQGMSDKTWEVTIKHASTCNMGNKHYIFRGSSFEVTLNPICQVVNATINGRSYSSEDLHCIRRFIEPLVRQAYAAWQSLEEVVGVSIETPLLTREETLLPSLQSFLQGKWIDLKVPSKGRADVDDERLEFSSTLSFDHASSLKSLGMKETQLDFDKLREITSKCMKSSSKNTWNELVHEEAIQEIQLLSRPVYPPKSLPAYSHPVYLVELNLRRSSIQQLWAGKQPFVNLKSINLKHSKVTTIPDLSEAQKLNKLNLRGCKSLQSLPSMNDLKLLTTLILTDCSNLKEIPELSTSIQYLFLAGTAIEELPLSIGCLSDLIKLDLRNCSMLRSLPSSICELQHLEYLDIAGCTILLELLESISLP